MQNTIQKGSEKNLYQIIEQAKDGNKPTYDECYWSMLVLDSLLTFSSEDLRLAKKSPKMIDFIISESHKRIKNALGKIPKNFIGWENDPANPEHQKFRKLALKLFDKALKDEP